MRVEYSKLHLSDGLKSLILFELEGMHNFSDDFSVLVDTYQNGREKGYTLITIRDGKTKQVTFSEARSSDSIAVYLENKACQGLDEDSYQNQKSFGAGKYSEVVKFCVDYLNNEE